MEPLVNHVYCPECGFLNPATANYCPRCGALLATETGSESTMSFDLDTSGEEPDATATPSSLRGPALVVRSGGGMAGQVFQPQDGKTLIGRSPECEIFLDDVTVSRQHAELERDGDSFTIRDLGSLNGTYVNRRRIESTVLQDDDEVQIGKYRLTFLQR
jgi:FHA domain/zinc-ribbon domain